MSYLNGPMSGSTPSDQNELHGNGENQYAQGSPSVDLQRSSDYPTTSSIAGAPGNPSILGYYSNPAPDPMNPYTGGIGTYTSGEQQVAGYVADMLDTVYSAQVQDQQPSDWPEDSANLAAIDNDEGFGTSGNGRS